MAKGIYVGADDLKNILPNITNSEGVSGYVPFASSAYNDTSHAFYAFTYFGNAWHSTAGMPQTIGIKLPEKQKVLSFAIRNVNSETHRGINGFKFQGSNDGSSYIDLGTYTNPDIVGKTTRYTVSNPDLYQYYRIYITSSHYIQGNTSYAVIEQISLFTGETTPNIARKVKKMYIGVESKARRVKKGYIGIGGVARPFFGGYDKLTYYGSITPLSAHRYDLYGTFNEKYALLGGGKHNINATGHDARVDAYDATLTKSTTVGLSYGRRYISCASIGAFGLFCGGLLNNSPDNTVDAFDEMLTRTSPEKLLSASSQGASGSNGEYAVIGGGSTIPSGYTNIVTAYDKSLIRYEPAVMDTATCQFSGTNIGDYVLLGGGRTNITAVYAYDKNLTKTKPTALSLGRNMLVAASNEKYALFAGGHNSADGKKSTVDAYDKFLTRTTAPALSEGKEAMGATNIGQFIIFAGGYTGGNYTSSTDVYDENLTKISVNGLSVARAYIGASHVGDFALFGGGQNTVYNDTVDAYMAF